MRANVINDELLTCLKEVKSINLKMRKINLKLEEIEEQLSDSEFEDADEDEITDLNVYIQNIFQDLNISFNRTLELGTKVKKIEPNTEIINLHWDLLNFISAEDYLNCHEITEKLKRMN
jgi:hypothetical protein